ncbi:MAG TPA: APC family permease [Gemmatimonadaceae bacterium]|nr:APC family permease [Gemmatimonadaceae bacterium]
MPDPLPAAPRSDAALLRALGPWALTAGIVNVTIGGGIFRLPGSAAQVLGAAAPLAWVCCALVMGIVVVCFAEAGSRVALTGGPYAYVEVAFGPLVGFLVGVLLWAAMSAALAAVTTFFADSLGALLPPFAGPVARVVTVIAVLGALALLNVRGVRGASRFNNVMTLAKLAPLALFVLVGAFAVRGENLAVAAVPPGAELAHASALLIFAFLGMEAALMPSGEVRDPARTVPRAVFVALLAVTVVYLAVHLVSQGVLGPALAGRPTPVADAAGAALGGWGRTLVLVGSVVSMFGYVSGMTLAVPRALLAFGRDGFLPAPLAAVHPRFRTPHVAIVVQTVVTVGLALSGAFETLALAANGAALIAYAACCAAAWQLRRTDVRQAGGVPFRSPLGAVAPWLALAGIAWLLVGLTAREWIAIAALVGVGAVLYAVTRGRREAMAAVASAEAGGR